jgi:hypothetical protein
MRIRRLVLAVVLTLLLVAIAIWLISGYQPLTPARNVPIVAAQFDGARAMQFLDALAHRFKGRTVGTAQGFASANYVAGQFRSFGLQVEMQNFREAGGMSAISDSGWYSGQNVIGILPGREQAAVVLTAHRDCVPRAPEGAYDNGSGTAAVMELARVLAAGKPHRYTYAFIAIDGEEIGFGGARALLNHRPAALSDIRLMANLDMVGHKESSKLTITHTQYLSPEARALTATHFDIPRYKPFQLPLGRGTDAQLFVLRRLPTIDFREILPIGTKPTNHHAGDTYDQISSDSVQLAGRAVEQLILLGDATGAFTPSQGLIASNDEGILPNWRYKLSGLCFFVIFLLPLLFQLRSIPFETRPAMLMIGFILLTGILTALSTLWSGSAAFTALPLPLIFSFLVLQAVVLSFAKSPDRGLGRLLIAAAPTLVFAGTWWITGLWSLGLAIAVLAWFPAALLTWRTGIGWRLLDVAQLLPILLLTILIAMASWFLAPLHFFPPIILAVFTALFMAIALIGIWGIFGRRPPRRAFIAPASEASTDLGATADI